MINLQSILQILIQFLLSFIWGTYPVIRAKIHNLTLKGSLLSWTVASKINSYLSCRTCQPYLDILSTYFYNLTWKGLLLAWTVASKINRYYMTCRTSQPYPGILSTYFYQLNQLFYPHVSRRSSTLTLISPRTFM